MLDGKVLVLKRSAVVYRHHACPVTLEEVASLNHKVLDDTVKDGVLEALRDVVPSVLACAELSCLTCKLWRASRGDFLLKFSAVFGTISLYSSILSLPIAVSPMEMSKKTIGRDMVGLVIDRAGPVSLSPTRHLMAVANSAYHAVVRSRESAQPKMLVAHRDAANGFTVLQSLEHK